MSKTLELEGAYHQIQLFPGGPGLIKIYFTGASLGLEFRWDDDLINEINSLSPKDYKGIDKLASELWDSAQKNRLFVGQCL